MMRVDASCYYLRRDTAPPSSGVMLRSRCRSATPFGSILLALFFSFAAAAFRFRCVVVCIDDPPPGWHGRELIVELPHLAGVTYMDVLDKFDLNGDIYLDHVTIGERPMESFDVALRIVHTAYRSDPRLVLDGPPLIFHVGLNDEVDEPPEEATVMESIYGEVQRRFKSTEGSAETSAAAHHHHGTNWNAQPAQWMHPSMRFPAQFGSHMMMPGGMGSYHPGFGMVPGMPGFHMGFPSFPSFSDGHVLPAGTQMPKGKREQHQRSSGAGGSGSTGHAGGSGGKGGRGSQFNSPVPPQGQEFTLREADHRGTKDKYGGMTVTVHIVWPSTYGKVRRKVLRAVAGVRQRAGKSTASDARVIILNRKGAEMCNGDDSESIQKPHHVAVWRFQIVSGDSSQDEDEGGVDGRPSEISPQCSTTSRRHSRAGAVVLLMQPWSPCSSRKPASVTGTKNSRLTSMLHTSVNWILGLRLTPCWPTHLESATQLSPWHLQQAHLFPHLLLQHQPDLRM